MSKVHYISCDKPNLFYFYLILTCFTIIFGPSIQLATLTGHTYKVLYVAISPEGHVFQFFYLFIFIYYCVYVYV